MKAMALVAVLALMRHATVVVAKSDLGDDALFAQRANNIKLALSSRGVDAGRIRIGANAQ